VLLTLADQAAVGALLGAGLAAAGFLRVYLTNGDVTNAFAISLSLLCIVMTSVVLGTVLPFCLAEVGVDPANAGTSIQVVMDILGVIITCVLCHLVLVQFATSTAAATAVAATGAAAAAAAAAGAG
jgi:Mg/Co/Ni transporter MgtE